MQIPNYRVKEVIGRGGMATVYRAEHILLKQERALKVISPSLSREPGFQQSFIREGQIIASLQHPHIVNIYDIDYCDEGYFMAMEYLTGGSLSDKLKNSPLSLEMTFRVLRQIGEALHYAHEQGLVHRDIKPANILFRDNGEAVLTDFGISKLQDTESELTRLGYGLLGTPRYMSPEQTGAQKLDRRSDIYSLALVFYEMLAGKPAIQADATISIIREHVLAPPPIIPAPFGFLQPIINKALAKTPDKRYANVLEFVEAVTRQKPLDENKTVVIPTSVSMTNPPQQAKSAKRKKRFQLVLYLFPLLVLASVAWWVSVRFKVMATVERMVSVQSQPEKPQADKMEPVNNRPVQKKTEQMKPEQNQPVMAKPERTEQKQTKIGRLQPAQVEPVRVERKPEPTPVAQKEITSPSNWVEIDTHPSRMTVRAVPYAILYAGPDNQRVGI